MSLHFVTNERIAETSSKGNQEKWIDENRWYKLDQFGYEALAETLISQLLELSNCEKDYPFRFTRYRMERFTAHGIERTGCSSENFLQSDQSIITLSHLYKRESEVSLRDLLSRQSSDRKRIAYLADATAELTGLERFPQYLTLLFEVDALFLNDDRHLNNIAVLECGGKYDYCPIFDNGAGLLSNTRTAPMDIEPKALIAAQRARPFNIFCSTTDAVKAVAKELDKDYPGDVAIYHGRDKHSEKQLLAGEKHIIVATNALAMGVDLHNVDLVILFNMPASASELYQMAGRAGREGQSAHCVLIYNPKDYQTRYYLLQNIPEKEARRKELHRLDRLKEICEDERRCLTNLILAELGQERDTVCRYCSTCQREKREARR